MSLTQTPDNNSDFEGIQISSGPTSRTTTGQFTGIMSLQEQFESFIKNANQEKENEIQKLKDENERLKEEIDRLKQKASDPQGITLKNKASELKKVLDEFLDPNRTIFQPRLHHSNYSISLPNGNADVNKSAISTNENKFRPGPADEPSSFHMPRSINYNNQEDFGTRQEFRPESDAELINQATQEEMSMSRQHYSHHSNHPHNNLPTAYNLGGMNQKRFNNYNNGLGGTNNNNNNNRNRNNHNNNSNKYTIFISWPGNMTKEQLQELFDSSGIDIADIRYTSPKQFAHVDLKSENALNKAMTLNGVTKHEKQGALRVEHGKPRNNNNNNNNNNHPTENGQRPQNQNKSYNRQNNNKNSNYNNNNSPQKPNGKYPNYNHNNTHHTNHNNHNSNSQYQPASFTSDEKESGTNSWQHFSTQETSQNIE